VAHSSSPDLARVDCRVRSRGHVGGQGHAPLRRQHLPSRLPAVPAPPGRSNRRTLLTRSAIGPESRRNTPRTAKPSAEQRKPRTTRAPPEPRACSRSRTSSGCRGGLGMRGSRSTPSSLPNDRSALQHRYTRTVEGETSRVGRGAWSASSGTWPMPGSRTRAAGNRSTSLHVMESLPRLRQQPAHFGSVGKLARAHSFQPPFSA
jgi:hypothetical protein